MFTSLLDHAFGVRGCEYRSTEYAKGGITMTIEQPRAALSCSRCDGRHVPAKGGVTREFRALPIGGQPVRLKRTVPRVLCRTCFVERQVKVASTTTQGQIAHHRLPTTVCSPPSARHRLPATVCPPPSARHAVRR